MLKPLLALCVAFASIWAPSCCATRCEDGASAAAASAPRGATHEYVFVVLRAPASKPDLTDEQSKQAMAGHMANIKRLAEAGDLLVAGPFGKGNPKPERRGIFVFAGGHMERALELTATDPALIAGVMTAEALPLSSTLDFHRAQELDREYLNESETSGAPFPMHSYVLAIVDGGAKAGPALAGLHGKGVVFSGELGGAREGAHLVLINAPNLEAADAVLAPIRAKLGAVDASPWWASASLLEVARAREGAR